MLLRKSAINNNNFIASTSIPPIEVDAIKYRPSTLLHALHPLPCMNYKVISERYVVSLTTFLFISTVFSQPRLRGVRRGQNSKNKSKFCCGNVWEMLLWSDSWPVHGGFWSSWDLELVNLSLKDWSHVKTLFICKLFTHAIKSHIALPISVPSWRAQL